MAKAQTAQIALMNLPRVVATWGWRRPSKDLFTIVGDDRHGVSSFNFTNIIPTDQVSESGIHNLDSLIKEDDLGFVHDQAHTTGKACSPSKCDCASAKITREDGLQIHSGQQKNQDKETNDTGFASKSFWIIAWQDFRSHIAVSLHKLGRQSV